MIELKESYRSLDTLHSTYRDLSGDRVKCRDIYEGTKAVRAKRTAYLVQNTRESDTEYDKRLSMSVLDPWAKKIVGAAMGLLFRNRADRGVVESAGFDTENVDRNGTSAHQFFKSVAEDAAVDGIAYVLVDMPRTPEGGFISKRDENLAEHRPYFTQIDAASVLDWRMGHDNHLEWCVIRESVESPEQDRGPGDEREVVTQYRVWTRAEWGVYRIDTDGSAEARLVESGTHDLGQVPLVPFFGQKAGPMTGKSVLSQVADHIILIYNKESDKHWFEKLAAHPLPVIRGSKEPTLLDSGKGLFLNTSEGGDVGAEYLEVSGAGFKSLQESIASLQSRVLSITLGINQKDSAQVQSAESKREDRLIFTSQMRDASINLGDAETRCWELVAAWLGQKLPSRFTVAYPQEFDDALITETVLVSFSEMMEAGQISHETLLELIARAKVIPGFDPKEERKRIEAQKTGDVASTLMALERTPIQSAPPEA